MRIQPSIFHRLLTKPVVRGLPFRQLATTAQQHANLNTTVNVDEIAHFSKLSALWWDERGEFQMLHRMNPTRIRFVREKLAEIALEDDPSSAINEATTLKGLEVLDVGCGGGLLSESLARLGAHTLGIDASPANISIASLHARADSSLNLDAPRASEGNTIGTSKGSLSYLHTSVEDLLAQRGPGSFDAVCSMEVLEHVDNPRGFLHSCAQLVKPGGHLFLSTIARTPLAYLITIFAAEDVLNRVSKGTHTYSKFVNPDELRQFFGTYQSSPDQRPWISTPDSPSRTEAEVRGMIYAPWNGTWELGPRESAWSEGCNYLFWARRPTP